MSPPDRARFDAAEAILRERVVEVPAGARSRVALGVLTQTEKPRITWAHAGLAMSAAAAVLLLRVAPPPSAPAPLPAEPARAELAAGVETQVGPARVRVLQPALLELPTPEAPAVIRLWTGTVAFDDGPGAAVARAKPVELHTRQVRLQLMAARFEVRADERRTTVVVESGEVWAYVGHEPTPHVLTAGRRVQFDAPEPGATAPSAPEVRAAPTAAEAPTTPTRAAPAKRAPASAPAREASAPTPAELRDARRLQPAEAERLAERVIEASPAPEVEIEALLLLADARRRAGRDEAAVEAYGRALEHPARADFEEEARYQIARALARLGRGPEAGRHLAAAETRHPHGPLAPERAALWARLRLDAGDVDGAARVLERGPRAGWSRALDEVRIAVAQRLLPTSPKRAEDLASQVISAARADDLVGAARKIERRAKEFEGASKTRRPMGEP